MQLVTVHASLTPPVGLSDAGRLSARPSPWKAGRLVDRQRRSLSRLTSYERSTRSAKGRG